MFLLVDVGSTWTKLTVVNQQGKICGQASAPTTVEDGVMEGYNQALKDIRGQVELGELEIYACSSAAGGLTMVASGLVPELTGQAAKMAVLGAGAKVQQVYGYTLNEDDLEDIEAMRPDMMLLAGGTDGGNRQILLENATALAEHVTPLPVVLAGNRNVARKAADLLSQAGFVVDITGNVMPQLGQLDIEPARNSIRKLFLEHIVRAKGMEDLSQQLAGPLIPTPAAVMNGGKLLAEQIDQLLMVDIGGATTDVYTFGAEGVPAGMMRKGLAPPREMRTVEADIGMRYSLESLVEQVGVENVLAQAPVGAQWQVELERIMAAPDLLVSPGMEDMETFLAHQAVKIAISRHAGSWERIYSPTGPVDVLRGKDLRGIRSVVGIGGVLVNAQRPQEVLKLEPQGLLPTQPQLQLDKNYVMAAAGLLAETHPDVANKLLADSLAEI